ncbi:MAG: hypothetical protein RIC55_24840 [Pirellulaceae bacterium]
MSKRTVSVAFLLGLFCGVLLGVCATAAIVFNEGIQANYHWSRVAAYKETMNDRSNWSEDPTIDGPVISIDEPYDVMPSIQALVSLGELERGDLVFANVTRTPETLAYTDTYMREHPDIVWMQSPAIPYPPLPMTGRQPLHLQVWYRPSASDDVRRMVEEIEARHANGSIDEDP